VLLSTRITQPASLTRHNDESQITPYQWSHQTRLHVWDQWEIPQRSFQFTNFKLLWSSATATNLPFHLSSSISVDLYFICQRYNWILIEWHIPTNEQSVKHNDTKLPKLYENNWKFHNNWAIASKCISDDSRIKYM